LVVEQKIKLIFNPTADKGHAWKQADTIKGFFDKTSDSLWCTTETPGHATEIAYKAAEEGFTTVAALGGDGTVHEVINGLMQIRKEIRPNLGVIPLGSGNDFANNNGVESDPELAASRLLSGTPKAIDIGFLEDNTGGTAYWDNTLGIGFDASVTIQSRKITRLQGFPMYLWAVIQTIILHHDVAHMRIETDTETIEQDVLMLVLCNGPREGGGFHVAPDATSDDNLFNYAMIKDVSRLMMFRLIPEVMNGTHGRFKEVKLGSFRDFHLTFDRPMAIHADGEIYIGFDSEVRELSVKLLPSELQLIL
jgi:YegS/Rv2252/BmrU family lipid kinase